MSNLDSAIQESRAVLDDVYQATLDAKNMWHTPRDVGKWSPAQVIEHVIRSYRESKNDVVGEPSKFPNLPFFLRPLARAMVLGATLKRGSVGRKAKTLKPFDPVAQSFTGPESPESANELLKEVFEEFEQACRECSSKNGTFKSSLFGAVSVEEYASFQAIHTRHHLQQILDQLN
ncbi:MAG: DUF1569 domain-containing protein [Gemmatimonadota bacterium]|nr:DUF1569 domain-containing protein [Gemmatimonadota bacterium]